MGFIVRILQYLFMFLVYAGVFALIALVTFYVARFLWEVFEHMFEDQAAWLKTKFGLFKPFRNCSTIIITVVVTLAVVAFIWFVFLSGQSSQGGVLP